MKPMGALQPGIPSPTTIPQNWHIIITELQDFLFNILLHPLGDTHFLSLILIISGLIKDFNRLYYLKVCLTVPLFVKIL